MRIRSTQMALLYSTSLHTSTCLWLLYRMEMCLSGGGKWQGHRPDDATRRRFGGDFTLLCSGRCGLLVGFCEFGCAAYLGPARTPEHVGREEARVYSPPFVSPLAFLFVSVLVSAQPLRSHHGQLPGPEGQAT